MLRFLLICHFIGISSSGFAQIVPEGQEIPYVIAEGEAFAVEDRGFTIQAPVGWEVYRDMNGATIFMQAPKEEGLIYQRNIRVMAFNEPEFIDEMTFEEYEQKIVENSTKMSNAVVDYRIRNRTTIELAGGLPAGLFYAEFMIDGIPMMQMHILASSAENHFILTYTDLQEHFEMDNSPYLAEAFSSLQSVELNSSPPSRNRSVILIGGLAIGLLSLLVAVKIIRARKVKALADGLDEYGEDEDIADPSDPVESQLESALSDLKSKKRKSRKKSKSSRASMEHQSEDNSDEDVFEFDSQDAPIETLVSAPLDRPQPPPPPSRQKPSVDTQQPVTPPPPPGLGRPERVATKLDGEPGHGRSNPPPPPPSDSLEEGVVGDFDDAEQLSDLNELRLGKAKRKKAKHRSKRVGKSRGVESTAAAKLANEDLDLADVDEDEEDTWNL